MNYVGDRQNGVNLPRKLQEMGLAGDRNLAAWTGTDMSSGTRRTTMKGGLVWSDVVARVTADAVSGEILDSELARDIPRSLEHTPVDGGPRDIQTILVFEASKVKSPPLILQDSVRRGGVRGYGMHNDWNSRDKKCELQESVNQQKVECSNNNEGYNKMFQACAMVDR